MFTWNGGKGNSKTADISNVHWSLEQRLDCIEWRRVLREVRHGPRVARLLLARAQLVEVAVGGHVGAGGGDHHQDQHHQGGHHRGHIDVHFQMVVSMSVDYLVIMMVT